MAHSVHIAVTISIKSYFYDYQFHDHERVMNMWVNDVQKQTNKKRVKLIVIYYK